MVLGIYTDMESSSQAVSVIFWGGQLLASPGHFPLLKSLLQQAGVCPTGPCYMYAQFLLKSNSSSSFLDLHNTHLSSLKAPVSSCHCSCIWSQKNYRSLLCSTEHLEIGMGRSWTTVLLSKYFIPTPSWYDLERGYSPFITLQIKCTSKLQGTYARKFSPIDWNNC